MRTATIKGSPWIVCISGFRVGRVDDTRRLVNAVAEAAAPSITQLLDAGRVAGYDHLLMAAVNAAKSMETGMAVSKTIAVESLLYASARDQITKALGLMGLTTRSTKVAIMVFATTEKNAVAAYGEAAKLLGEEDDSVLDLDVEKSKTLKKAYEITDTEIEAIGGPDTLTKLIVERGALLSIRR